MKFEHFLASACLMCLSSFVVADSSEEERHVARGGGDSREFRRGGYGVGRGYGGGYGNDYKHDPNYEYGYNVKVPSGKSYDNQGGYGGDGYGRGGYGASWDSSEFGHSEKRYGDKTDGKYFVLLPDGRLQTVEYNVDGYSGYVAKVSYSRGKERDSYYGQQNRAPYYE